ncbi:hypothetical protein BKA93DRAFT_798099 [Sparassis latifolia]|uniref:Uncharacterized protein n=1 Tax=Sparassis crispa TaxID=139825 RepID=A0A401H0H9_9APHY|nr:hypothetical protein SCP_1201470 [Sparassis crispa]GBE87921.1 hypothetical protein SCP_1201470 [Sparassis crispa]
MSLLGYGSAHDYQRQQSSSPMMHRIPIPNPGANNGAPFKAPAHKHAHHLHSIPPREKSTRTLIIDHLLWVHGRTRFAQARAELGMTDRTGGPSTSNYAHRERPENYEEEEEVYSDGEDVNVLKARAGGPGHPHGDEEEERFERQDLQLARSLRLRAESVEKVATSILDQPPQVPPLHPDDMLETPTSPQLRPQAAPLHQHTLPNGVRLRLALATVVNDLFSRRAPIPLGRHPSAQMSAPPVLPSALVPLAAISSASANHRSPSSTTRRPHPSDYIRSLYNVGAEEDNQNSPPSLRCPRHLHMGCEICVESKSQTSSRGGGSSRGRSVPGRTVSSTGSSPDDMGNQSSGALVGGVTGWQDGSGIGSGLARPGPRGTVLRRPSGAASAASDANAMSNTKLAELIVRFMRLSALVAMELGREATEDRISLDGGESRGEDGASAPQAQAASSSAPRGLMSPRPLGQRQLAAEAGMFYHALRPSREWYFLLAGLLTRAVFEGYMSAGWRGTEPLEVLLGVGLGMVPLKSHPPQATNGNQGGAMSRENGNEQNVDKEREEDNDFTAFDPDDLPDLEDTARVLFPSLRDVGVGPGGAPYYRREGGELEYEMEMKDRLSRFYDVPGSTPDLATHMEDLAWQFPGEVVERAAVRFCEAVARWRGKPELETYKKAPWVAGQREHRTSGGTAMSIDALVHSNPTSPSNTADHASVQSPYRPEPPRNRRPPIERYFTVPQLLLMQGRKRRRSDTDRGEEGRRGFS